MLSFIRLIKFVVFFVREVVALRRFKRGKGNSNSPSLLVEKLINLGPVFVKLGQVLSTRSDLLPSEYTRALASLQEEQPQVPWDQISQHLLAQFGQPASELFATINPVPVAAATLAQVHEATLHDGTHVAVKVQRPNVADDVIRDLEILDMGVRWLARLSPGRTNRANLPAFVREFKKYTLDELDFAAEGHSIETFAQNLFDLQYVKLPSVYWDYTSTTILTMDWVNGLSLTKMKAELDTTTRETLVTHLVEVLLRMFVSDGYFHADLHPGNIRFYGDGTFALMDFGMVGRLTPAQSNRFILYLLAVVQRQTKRAFSHFVAQTHKLPDADEDAFQAVFETLADQFYNSSLTETSFAKVYLKMMQAGYEFGFIFPSELLLHAKALTTAEALIFTLSPDVRFEKIARPFVAELVANRALSHTNLTDRLNQMLPELLLLGELPPADAIDQVWDRSASAAIGDQVGSALMGQLERFANNNGLWRSLFVKDARRFLLEEDSSFPVDQVLELTWKNYEKLEKSILVQPTTGAVFTTHVAAVILAMHQAMLANNVDPHKAPGLIYQIGWRFYDRMGELPLLMARSVTKDPAKRLRIATNLFRTFPFGSPSYQWSDVQSGPQTVAFDCQKCPMAEFFIAHDAADLCVQTACKLDYPLATKWGGRLERTNTIAGGAEFCDFRWHA